jgi:probable blue pigment (indigoidine) exporter
VTTPVVRDVYQPGATGQAVGITLTLVSVPCCALYTVLTRRLMLDDSSLNVVLAQQAAALVFALLLATVSRWPVAPDGT